MSITAKTAKIAKTRAKIASEIIKRSYIFGHEFGRDFDDCFEMNDGDEVVNHLTEMARTDKELARAILDREPLTDANGSLKNACNECLNRLDMGVHNLRNEVKKLDIIEKLITECETSEMWGNIGELWDKVRDNLYDIQGIVNGNLETKEKELFKEKIKTA